MTTPSTRESRNLYVAEETVLATFSVLGEPPFAVIPPVTIPRGHYRVELDFATHIASITPAAEEASP